MYKSPELQVVVPLEHSDTDVTMDEDLISDSKGKLRKEGMVCTDPGDAHGGVQYGQEGASQMPPEGLLAANSCLCTRTRITVPGWGGGVLSSLYSFCF